MKFFSTLFLACLTSNAMANGREKPTSEEVMKSACARMMSIVYEQKYRQNSEKIYNVTQDTTNQSEMILANTNGNNNIIEADWGVRVLPNGYDLNYLCEFIFFNSGPTQFLGDFYDQILKVIFDGLDSETGRHTLIMEAVVPYALAEQNQNKPLVLICTEFDVRTILVNH